uniref:platelet glycoprotein IX n=1 Tax=Myxine glutinosa TaxID=7769 RepID=UPI00358F48B9
MSRLYSSSSAALLLLFAMLLAAANSESVPHNCSLPGCTCTKESKSTKYVDVICQRSNPKMFFENIPAFTKSLKFNEAGLTYLPNGALDRLHHLEEVDFHKNPWHCDCNIIYLRQWLEDNMAISKGHPTCGTPNKLETTRVKDLTGNEFENCLKKPPGCWDLVLRDMGLHMISLLLLIPLFSALCSVRSKTLLSCKRARAAEPPQSEESIYEEVDRGLAFSAM